MAAIADGDELDAYFRARREEAEKHLPIHPMVENLGPWAAKWYGGQRFRAATTDGLTRLYKLDEGWPQGCGFSPDAYQAIGTILDAALPLSSSVTFEEGGQQIPATKFSFSDDRRFLEGSMGELAGTTKLVEKGSRRLGRIVHPDKQAFACLLLKEEKVQQVEVPVPGYDDTVTTNTY